MDTALPTTTRSGPRRLRLALLGGGALLALAAAAFWLTRPARLRLDPAGLELATVSRAPFHEYINLEGRLEPGDSYLIDGRVAGTIERVYVESGATLRPGDTLLRLSNADLELEVLEREGQLFDQLDGQRRTRLLLDQNDFTRREQIVEIDHQLALQTRQFRRDSGLFASGDLAPADYELTANRYAFLQDRRRLLRAARRADSLARRRQLTKLAEAEGRIRANVGRLRTILDRLYVRAPVGGRLGDFRPRAGQAIAAGDRLGEIYDLADPRLIAEVDEYYLDRVRVGQTGLVLGRGDSARVTIDKIYPTVENGRFRVEARFPAGGAEGLVRGQTLRFRLRFGAAEPAVLLPAGAFYAATGGHWVYRLAGETAERVPVRLGRRNPDHYEVLAGLAPGDRVIVSAYDDYQDYTTLQFK